MEEEVKFVLDTAKEAMKEALDHLDRKLRNIRAGKASPQMVHSVMVEYYGSPTPLTQVANINTPDGMTISIQPWEKGIIPDIERAIQQANLGFNPMNNGESVIINVPPLTEERRKELVKQVRAEAEESKIAIRNDRRNANEELKKMELTEDLEKDMLDEVQKLTDKHIALVDEALKVKEDEVMTV
ncbi:MAG TPA: ribosome recycling factor [Flavobacteriaceae bacterium]|nr:ribosome recycling factor [Flavobacteriaceae bacterium]